LVVERVLPALAEMWLAMVVLVVVLLGEAQ
jgi:hypothetical protein